MNEWIKGFDKNFNLFKTDYRIKEMDQETNTKKMSAYKKYSGYRI